MDIFPSKMMWYRADSSFQEKENQEQIYTETTAI